MKQERAEYVELLRKFATQAVSFDDILEVAEVSFEGPDENLLASVLLWHPNRVDMNLCEKVSNILNEILDKEDPFKESYTLEVASLSLTRKLKTADDFRRACGETINVKYRDKAKPEVSGKLTNSQVGLVHIVVGKQSLQISIEEIKHATIVF